MRGDGLAAAALIANLVAKCPENEGLLNFMRQRQRELCGEWDGALTRAFRLAIISIAECTTPVRTLHDASKIRHIGPSMQKQIRPFFATRPPVHRYERLLAQGAAVTSDSGAVGSAGIGRGGGASSLVSPLSVVPAASGSAFSGETAALPDAEGTSRGGSSGGPAQPTRKKFVGYVPKKGSPAHAIIVTLLVEKLRGREWVGKDELLNATRMCCLTDPDLQPKPLPSGRPMLERQAPRMFHCSWSSVEMLKRHKLIALAPTDDDADTAAGAAEGGGQGATGAAPQQAESSGGSTQKDAIGDGNGKERGKEKGDEKDEAKEESKVRFTLTPEGHAVAMECVRRARIALPTKEELVERAEAAKREKEAASRAKDSEPEPVVGLAALDPAAGPTALVERSSFDTLRLPPLRPGEKFLEAYEVILLIDSSSTNTSNSATSSGGIVNRDANQSHGNGQQLAEQLHSQFGILTEVRSLPVGDALWIAQHKVTQEDFVLDFILEHKGADELWTLISSKRFRDQKLRLQRCGLRKLLYLVEGSLKDVGASVLRSSALQAEMEDGFDVQRTDTPAETNRRYADLTFAITLRYSEAWNAFAAASATGANAALFGGQERCMTFDEFLHVCRHITSDGVGDMFGHMLLQIRGITVDAAMAIMQRYPTLRLLVEAYQTLEGNHEAQARLLSSTVAVKGKPVSDSISRKVFEYVWT